MKTRSILSLACAAMVMLTDGTALATTYYWDTDGNIGGFGDAAGTWGTSAFWSTNGTGASTTANTTITTSDGINFGTASLALGPTASAVGVNGAVTVNSITFGAAQATAVTLSGGTSITLGGTTPTITVNNTADTINSILAGSSTLTKTGTGTLTLSGANSYTGQTTINEGILKLQGNAFSTKNRTYSIASGAVLSIDGATDIAAGTTIINGTGTLRKTGTGNWMSSGDVRDVTMSLGVGALIDVQTGASFANGGWQAFTWTSNQASMNVDGVFDTWDGNAVTIDALTGSGTITKGATTYGSPILNLGTANGSGVFSGVIQNTAGSLALVKNGTGTQTLAGNNTYSGTTTVNNGTLLVNGSINSAVTVVSGAYLGGTGAITGTVTFASGARATFTNNAPLRFAGTVTLNNNTVYLTLPNNLAAGTYLLATNTTGSFSGTFAATPVITNGSSVGACTITNDTRAVRLTVAPPPILWVSVTAPVNGRIFLPGSSVTATVSVVNGTMPYTVTFYTNSAVAWSTNSASTNLFNINLGALADGTYTHYATVTDSVSSNATSSTNSFTLAPDTMAPTPDPMSFAVNPVAWDASTVVMTATTATDTLSPPVAYFFTNTVNGSNSGWISGTVWTNSGLTKGTTYGYQVMARDAVSNKTDFSSVFNAVPAEPTIFWDANGTGASRTDGAGTWLSANQWWDGIANVTWNNGIPNNAVIGNGGAGGTITLGTVTAGSVVLTNFTGTYTLSGGSLTQSGGITIATNAGDVTITSAIGGTGGLTKNGIGYLNMLNAIPSFSGDLVINGGEVMTPNNSFTTPTGNITLNGGVILSYWGDTLSRSLGSGVGQIQVPGGVSGFSGQGTTGMTIKFNNSTAYEVVWGAANEAGNSNATGYFNPSTLVLQSPKANAGGNVNFQNPINLNGTTRTIAVNKDPGATGGNATISGLIRNSTGTAGIIKTGVGKLILSGVNIYNGDTTVSAGTLQLNNVNTSNQLSTVTIAATGATLNLNFTGGATNTVDKLFIGTTQMDPGVYGTGAGYIVIPQIMGTGKLKVKTGKPKGTMVLFW